MITLLIIDYLGYHYKMYVCICHALTESDIAEAEDKGARNEVEIFSHCGVKPQCGRCLSDVRCRLRCLYAAKNDASSDAETEEAGILAVKSS
jgi:bacterioferritin-associated ferredoxin